MITCASITYLLLTWQWYNRSKRIKKSDCLDSFQILVKTIKGKVQRNFFAESHLLKLKRTYIKFSEMWQHIPSRFWKQEEEGKK